MSIDEIRDYICADSQLAFEKEDLRNAFIRKASAAAYLFDGNYPIPKKVDRMDIIRLNNDFLRPPRLLSRGAGTRGKNLNWILRWNAISAAVTPSDNLDDTELPPGV